MAWGSISFLCLSQADKNPEKTAADQRRFGMDQENIVAGDQQCDSKTDQGTADQTGNDDKDRTGVDEPAFAPQRPVSIEDAQQGKKRNDMEPVFPGIVLLE